jgi:3-deoxy-D-manno-octulosonate 8-phosphate phosphatase KdsC-like HAD superfamily phosphatase
MSKANARQVARDALHRMGLDDAVKQAHRRVQQGHAPTSEIRAGQGTIRKSSFWINRCRAWIPSDGCKTAE